MAQQLAVNAFTLSRLAQRLGYGGYSKLQDVFRREITEGKHYHCDQASHLVVITNAIESMNHADRQESANIATMIEQVETS